MSILRKVWGIVLFWAGLAAMVTGLLLASLGGLFRVEFLMGPGAWAALLGAIVCAAGAALEL